MNDAMPVIPSSLLNQGGGHPTRGRSSPALMCVMFLVVTMTEKVRRITELMHQCSRKTANQTKPISHMSSSIYERVTNVCNTACKRCLDPFYKVTRSRLLVYTVSVQTRFYVKWNGILQTKPNQSDICRL